MKVKQDVPLHAALKLQTSAVVGNLSLNYQSPVESMELVALRSPR